MLSFRVFKSFGWILALPLSACGGGGGNGPVVAMPPPPVVLTATTTIKTPLTNYAGLVNGTYDAVAVAVQRVGGVTTYSALGPSDVQLKVNADAKTYTLLMNMSGYPAEQEFALGTRLNDKKQVVETEFANHVVNDYKYSDGSTNKYEYDAVDANVVKEDSIDAKVGTNYYFGYNLGLRYVSYGYWASNDFTRDAAGGATFGDSHSFSFIAGTRTAPGDIPVTGTATYDAHVTGSAKSDIYFSQFSLLADFAARTIAADINVVPYYDSDYGPIMGVKGAGTSVISGAGDFAIPVAGSTSTVDEKNALKAGDSFTGSINGGFYGPQAAEVGGTIQLMQGSTMVHSSVFVGGRK